MCLRRTGDTVYLNFQASFAFKSAMWKQMENWLEIIKSRDIHTFLTCIVDFMFLHFIRLWSFLHNFLKIVSTVVKEPPTWGIQL